MNDLILRGLASFQASDAEKLAEVHKVSRDGGLLLSATGFCLIYWPQTPLESPQILHFYSEGSRAQTRELVRRTLDFIKEKGYNRFRATNRSGAPDPVWLRTFRDADWKQTAVLTVFDFEVKE